MLGLIELGALVDRSLVDFEAFEATQKNAPPKRGSVALTMNADIALKEEHDVSVVILQQSGRSGSQIFKVIQHDSLVPATVIATQDRVSKVVACATERIQTTNDRA